MTASSETIRVPFIDLSRTVQRLREDVLSSWTECLDGCEFVGGRRVAEFETKIASAMGLPHAVACANGTDAIIVALQAMGVGPGSKVAIPNLTFWATFEAVAQLGAIPVLVDIDPDDLQLSLDEFRGAHDIHRFDTAILVHLYGWASGRLGEIRAFCRERGIALLEDGAQSFGVTVDGAPVLSGAAIATTSFYPAKVLGGAMDGGAVLTSQLGLAIDVRIRCNHGRTGHYEHDRIGWNSRMSGLQAAYLSEVLELHDEIVESRRAAARWYRSRLTMPGVRLRTYAPPRGIQENGYLNVLTVDGKHGDEVVAKLKAAGIGAGRTYPIPLCSHTGAMRVNTVAHGDLMVSRTFCHRVVNLPLFFGIREDEQEAAVTALLEAIQ